MYAFMHVCMHVCICAYNLGSRIGDTGARGVQEDDLTGGVRGRALHAPPASRDVQPHALQQGAAAPASALHAPALARAAAATVAVKD